MSDLGSLVSSLKNAQNNAIPFIVGNIIEIISNEQLDETDIAALWNESLSLIQKPTPVITRNGMLLAEKLLELTNETHYVTVLQKILNSPLANSNKAIRDQAIDLSKSVIALLTPEVYWEKNKSFFNDKSSQLRESYLGLFLFTLQTYHEFKIKNVLKSIIDNTKHSSPEVRSYSYGILEIYYTNDPKKTTNFIKNNYPKDYESIISKITGQTKTKQVESFISMANAAQLSNEEIEEATVAEFDNPLPEIGPIQSLPNITQLSTKMKKSNRHWEERRDALSELLGYTRGTNDIKKFSLSLRGIQSELLDCALDARSNLCKHACLVITGMAAVLRKHFDPISEQFIPSLLGRTGHGTRIISLCSELCVLRIAVCVNGKRTAKALADGTKMVLKEGRLAAAKAIVAARSVWPKFPDVLAESLEMLVKDQNAAVREFASMAVAETQSVNPEFEEMIVEARRSKHTPIVSRGRFNPSPIVIPRPIPPPVEEVDEVNEVEEENVSIIDENKKNVIDEVDDLMEEINQNDPQNDKIIETKDDENTEIIKEDDSQYIGDPSDQNDIINEESPTIEEKEEININSKVDDITPLIEEKEVEKIVSILESGQKVKFHPDDLFDIIAMEMNEEADGPLSIRLLSTVLQQYPKELRPYVSAILKELPDDKERGFAYIDLLAKTYTLERIYKHISRINLNYIPEYLVTNALGMKSAPAIASVAVFAASKGLESDAIKLINVAYLNDPTSIEAACASCNDSNFIKLVSRVAPEIARLFNYRFEAKEEKPSPENLTRLICGSQDEALRALDTIRNMKTGLWMVDVMMEAAKSKNDIVLALTTSVFGDLCFRLPGFLSASIPKMQCEAGMLQVLGSGINAADETECASCFEPLHDLIDEGFRKPQTKYHSMYAAVGLCRKVGVEKLQEFSSMPATMRKGSEALVLKDSK